MFDVKIENMVKYRALKMGERSERMVVKVSQAVFPFDGVNMHITVLSKNAMY